MLFVYNCVVLIFVAHSFGFVSDCRCRARSFCAGTRCDCFVLVCSRCPCFCRAYVSVCDAFRCRGRCGVHSFFLFFCNASFFRFASRVVVVATHMLSFGVGSCCHGSFLGAIIFANPRPGDRATPELISDSDLDGDLFVSRELSFVYLFIFMYMNFTQHFPIVCFVG